MGDIMARPMRRWRQVFVVLGSFLFLYLLLLTSSSLPEVNSSRAYFGGLSSHQRPSQDVLNNLRLTEEQCDATFPGLTGDIERTVGQGPFALKPPSATMGPLQARIKNGEVGTT